MKNIQIREALKKANLKQWQLAEMLQIAETTLCRRLRKELSEDEKKEIIDLIANKNRGDDCDHK